MDFSQWQKMYAMQLELSSFLKLQGALIPLQIKICTIVVCTENEHPADEEKKDQKWKEMARKNGDLLVHTFNAERFFVFEWNKKKIAWRNTRTEKNNANTPKTLFNYYHVPRIDQSVEYKK